VGKTSIEWTDASWNPVVGCTEVSPGCANCYAARLASTRLRNTYQYKGLAVIGEGSPRWTGELLFLPERLSEPRHWKKPRRIFVCDMGDLFHEKVDITWIDQVFRMIEDCPQHTFQLLTKRAQNMNAYMLGRAAVLPNVWLGVSVENQHFADERIPLLLSTPAAVRWISAEPLLGPIGIRRFLFPAAYEKPVVGLDWVVCGGESGPNARPMHPDWARGLRDQCVAAGVPFFFKQWGAYVPCPYVPCEICCGKDHEHESVGLGSDGHVRVMGRVGKHAAGRELDGTDWSQFPHARA